MPPRLLYVPNEDGDGRQVGFRRPLANLLAAGLLDEVSIFSLQWRQRNGGDPREHRRDLVTRVKEFKPDLVLMQHLGSTRLTTSHFGEMRKAANFEFIYHEADPFSRFLHPLPFSARAAGRSADVVYTVGTGVFADNFRRAGSRDVRWSPHVFDSERFPVLPLLAESQKPFDVVVVGNRNRPRVRGHPNWRDRIHFVELLQERFGERVAVFGHNWTGTGAKGPVHFDQQVDAIRSGWVSANWDHYADEPKYFSNRLPISHSVGSIHATTHHPGYEEVFGPDTRDFLLTDSVPEKLVDRIEQYLFETTPAERIEAGNRAQEYANTFYRQDDHLVTMLNYRATIIDPLEAQQSWDITQEPLQEL